MFINAVKLRNYKSFKETEVDFNDFSLLVGANASGKSNLIASLRFLFDAGRFGFSDAISLQGGREFMALAGSVEPTELTYDIDVKSLFYTTRILKEKNNRGIRVEPFNFTYTVIISNDSEKPKLKQSAVIHYEYVESVGESRKSKGIGSLTINCSDSGKLTVNQSDIPKELTDFYGLKQADILHRFSLYFSLSEDLRNELNVELADTPIISHAAYVITNVGLDSFTFFDFDPRLAKQSSKFAGKKELEEDGSNFNVALNYVLADPKKKNTFLSTLADFLPFIKNLDVKQSIDNALLTVFAEGESRAFPSYAMSDGTLYIACLILGVTFSSKSFVVIEEPEKYIHPSLAIKVIEYLQANSKNKQILVTSHSPQLVSHAGINNLIVVTRKENSSYISRVSDLPQVKAFLENDIGLDQIFTDNLFIS